MKRLPLAMALALISLSASADSNVDALRAELDQLKQNYEKRISDLEQKLAQAEQRELQPPPPVAQAAVSASSGGFNPDTSVILDGKWGYFAHDPAGYSVPGFALPPETTPGTRGPSIGHSELRFAANIDPWLRGVFTAALSDSPDGHGTEVEIEEAYFETLGLGHGLTVRGGRFYSSIGYDNEKHAHEWDFADTSLPYRAMLGNEHYRDDGVQLSWLAPTDTFLQLGAEAFRGGGFPATPGGNGINSWSFFAKAGGDVGVSNSWLAGLSWLGYRAHDRSGGEEAHDTESLADEPDLTTLPFTGDGNLAIASLVWKWAPQGNPSSRNFKLQAEYFYRKEDGTLAYDSSLADYSSRDSGWYVQGIYQFMPRWRTGLRYDRLHAGNRSNDERLNEAFGAADAWTPHRWSAMVDYSPSEFSRFRLQYNRDNSSTYTDNQWFLQYILSLGSHGAHKF